MCGCNDNCSMCCDCPPRSTICIPRGDALRVIVDVRENTCDGDLYDLGGVSEIVFVAADELGGEYRIVKRMSTGGVSVSTNGYQFYFTIASAESASLTRNNNYFEIRVTTAGGAPKTVLCGVLSSPQTMAKDL